ncbi:MAG: hypothetical protein UW69_C0077G0006 [Microgenomates group bacterium GW2011_GWA2_44_7]|nr:MAG: hypothetical protein UW69_C0077G0006 [Microgenomates group bacterium GW2011_GWA2_44_7]
MAYACSFCGKTAIIGRQGSHRKGVAGGKWKKRAPRTARVFLPNLHMATINGTQVKLCSKCIRLAKGRQSKTSRKASKVSQAAASS